jgi:MarR family transcriptional regulator, lower aerobic nicotinate degradation pathway regulator
MANRQLKARKPAAPKRSSEPLRRPDAVVVNELIPRPRAARGEINMRPDPLVSPDVVWYRLLKLTNLMGRPFFTRFAQQNDLSINDWRVVVTLASMPESAAHELRQATGMHAMNVSRSVATLRRKGCITERTDPANRRRKILTLTEEGWDVYNRGVPQTRKLSEYLFASMSPIEVEFLGRLVDLLVQRLEEVDLEGGAFVGADGDEDDVSQA